MITQSKQKETKMETKNEKIVARIFEDVGGFYICDDASDCLDARGHGYRSKADALRAAAYDGYTHAIGSGTYWGNKVRSIARFSE